MLGRLMLLALNFAAAFATTTDGDSLPHLELGGDRGGRIDGSSWSNQSLNGKIWAIFYVDPDEKDSNLEMESAIKAAKFPQDQFGSIAIINMDATWLPNKVIEASLAKKQEEFPHVIYLKDRQKVLVKEWKLKDDSYEVLILNKQSKVIWQKAAPFTKEDTAQVLNAIRASLDASKP